MRIDMPYKDPEKNREYNRKWYAAANKEKLREYARKRYADNPEKSLEKTRKYRAANPEKERDRNRKWVAANPKKARGKNWKEQGIDIDWECFELILESQNYTCPICLRALDKTSSLTTVDHDHATGKIRGVLHSKCNSGIGYLGDDPENLIRAVEYLRNPPAVGLKA